MCVCESESESVSVCICVSVCETRRQIHTDDPKPSCRIHVYLREVQRS